MGQIILPDSYDPSFSNPRVKPVGNVEINWSHGDTTQLKLAVELINGELIDLVSGQPFIKSSNVVGLSHKGGDASLDFGSITDFDFISATLLADFSGRDYTIEIEFAADAWDSVGAVFVSWNDNGTNFYQYDDGSTQWFIGGNNPTTATTIPDDGAFRTVTMVCSSSANSLAYLNGVRESGSSSDPGVSNVASGLKTVHIGSFTSSGFSLGGRIKRVRIWKRTFTPAEVARSVREPYAILKLIQPPVLPITEAVVTGEPLSAFYTEAQRSVKSRHV